MDRLLVLVRHGQSDWNLKNLFTGWTDVGLTKLGIEQAQNAGRLLREHGIRFDVAFTSVLSRAEETCRLVLEDLGQPNLETIHDQALNERDYGDLTGLNKDDARIRWGDGTGPQVAAFLRRAATRRRKLERHGGAGAALLHPENPAAGYKS